MEHIESVTLEQLDWEQLGLLPWIAVALNAVNSISSNSPSPISGGEAHGSLWSEYGSQNAFYGVLDLESYLNERLACFQTAIRVQEEDLRLCHMEVIPCNFIIDLQGKLCLLDWANTGFCPRYLEPWSIEFAQHVMRSCFGLGLLQHLKATPAEVLGVQKWSLVYRYNSHFTLNRSYDETGAIMAAVAQTGTRSLAILS